MVHVPGESEYPYPPVAGASAYPPVPDVSDGGLDPGPGLPEAPSGGRLADRSDRAGDGRSVAVRGPHLAPGRRNRRLPQPAAAGAGTNWLIVGSDSRQGLSSTQANQLHTGTDQAVSGSRTDTIMLVHRPGNDTKPTMVSLLRDSYVTIPGHNRSKINAAFGIGGAAAGPDR